MKNIEQKIKQTFLSDVFASRGNSTGLFHKIGTDHNLKLVLVAVLFTDILPLAGKSECVE